MKTDTFNYVPSFLGKLGFLFGGIGAIALMERFPGLNWWADQSLWLNLLPLVTGPLFGFGIGYFLGKRFSPWS